MSKNQNNDGVINLRNISDEPEFRIHHVEESGQIAEDLGVRPVSPDNLEEHFVNSTNKVKIKFEKFVNLVATHAYEEIFDLHRDEEIIISSDLLADLANAHEEKEDKKMPLIFVLGIGLGIGLTWILLRT